MTSAATLHVSLSSTSHPRPLLWLLKRRLIVVAWASAALKSVPRPTLKAWNLRVLGVYSQILADAARVTDDHGVIVPGIGPYAPHLRVGAEIRAEIALDLVALTDVHPDPVHDLHVFHADPADRVGREGSPFAPDADDGFRAGLSSSGQGAGDEREGKSR